MSIYLTGGGEQEAFFKIDQEFLSYLPLHSDLLLVAQACPENQYHEAKERIEDCFKHKSVESISLLKDPKKMTWSELNHFEAIVIEGGNTFKLIKAIRDNSFFELIKKFAKTGKPIYADSAGAILLGADVETAFLGDDADEDHAKLQDYRGLDLIAPWAVHAHYEATEFKELEELLYSKGNPIIAMPESGGVIIEGETVVSMGSDPVDLVTFSGKITFAPGEQFSLI